MPNQGRVGEELHEGFRVLGTTEAAAECERVGHDFPSGLRHDLARMAMVADCRRCGYVGMLVQGGSDA